MQLIAPQLHASEEKARQLLESIVNDDFPGFVSQLESGTDPNSHYFSKTPDHWVNCLAAKKPSDKWLAKLMEFGGDLNFISDEYAANAGLSIYASALYCSVFTNKMASFTFLLENTDDPTIPICHLCKQDFFKRNLLEQCISFNKYQKAVWLLENTRFGPEMITGNIAHRLGQKGSAVREDALRWYWKTVDLVREAGYEVTPNIER